MNYLIVALISSFGIACCNLGFSQDLRKQFTSEELESILGVNTYGISGMITIHLQKNKHLIIKDLSNDKKISLDYSEFEMNGKKYSYKDSLHLIEAKDKLSEGSHELYIALDGIRDSRTDIVILKNGAQKFSIPKEYIQNFYIYNTFGPSSNQDELNAIFNSVNGLSAFVMSLKSCVLKKDIECLADYYFSETYKEKEQLKLFLRKVLLKRFIRDDENFCHKVETNEEEKLIKNELFLKYEKLVNKKSSRVWDSFEKALSMDLKYNYIVFESRKKILDYDAIHIYKNPLVSLGCGSWTDVKFDIVLINNQWKIASLRLTSEETI